MTPRDPTLVQFLIRRLFFRQRYRARATGKSMSVAALFDYQLDKLLAELPKPAEPIYPIYRNPVYATVS